MNDTIKHYIDVLVPIAYALATVATPICVFLTSFLGSVWYCIRIYEWLKGKTNGNVRND